MVRICRRDQYKSCQCVFNCQQWVVGGGKSTSFDSWSLFFNGWKFSCTRDNTIYIIYLTNTFHMLFILIGGW